MKSSVDSTPLGRLDEPAVDQVIGSGYVAESLRGQQHNERRDLCGRSEAPRGDIGRDCLPDLVRVLPRGCANRLRNPVFAKPEVSADLPGRHRVDPDSLWAE